MTRKLARACAVGILAFSVAAVVATGVTAVRVRDRIEPGAVVLVGDPNAPDMQHVQDQLEGWAEAGDPLTASLQLNAGFAVLAILVLLWVAVGALIVWRQPTNWAGWLFLIIGATVPVQSVASAAVITDLKAGGSLPLTGLAAWIGEFALYPATLFVLLLLLYPDGHPPSRRWRLGVAGLLGGTALAFLGFLLRPGPFNNFRGDGIVYENPLGIDAFTWAGTLIAAGTAIALAAGLSTVVAVIQRFRRSTGEERQQMRLLAFVAGVAGFWLVLAILVTFLGGALGLESEGSVPIFPILLGLAALTLILGIPAAYLVAIFRYRLWDIEVVIRKTLVALVLTLIIGGGALLVLALSTQVAWSLPDPLPFFWLMAVGAMALPFLRLARRIAKRVVFGKRATQQEVLAAFGERVGEGYAVVDVLPRMVRVLANATGATSARVLLRVGDELREEAAVGEATGEEHIVPVIYEGKELGALAATFPPNDPIDASKTQLMENLAGQASLALRNVKLIEELRASRQRLVAAQDEERRKLERNIHDGAQQQLVALAVKLRLAQGLVAKDPAKAEAMLGDLQSEAQTTLEDLRDLARGIYPPLLADKGLVAALEAQAKRAPIPVTVESDSTGRYPEAVESAVYFCALEALNNVAKYAEASRVTLSLAQTDGHLTFSVADDGRGFDPAETGYGTGLQGMADRLDAIGGSLEVRSVPTHGTTVVGLVPVRPGTAP